MSRSRSAHETPQPVEPPRSTPRSSRTSVYDGSFVVRRIAAKHAVHLTACVGDEQVGAAVAVVVTGRHPHARARVGDPRCRSTLFEAEPELGRVGLGASRPGDVLVQTVRVGVVGDVQVEVRVPVEIREQRSQPVREAGDLEPGVLPDLPKGHASRAAAAVVEKELVADAEDGVGETLCGVRIRRIGVRVAGHEQVGPPVRRSHPRRPLRPSSRRSRRRPARRPR